MLVHDLLQFVELHCMSRTRMIDVPLAEFHDNKLLIIWYALYSLPCFNDIGDGIKGQVEAQHDTGSLR